MDAEKNDELIPTKTKSPGGNEKQGPGKERDKDKNGSVKRIASRTQTNRLHLRAVSIHDRVRIRATLGVSNGKLQWRKKGAREVGARRPRR